MEIGHLYAVTILSLATSVAGSCAPYTLERSQTLQYFTLYVKQHGLCSNTEPISNLTECRGQCVSKTFFNLEENKFTTKCRCCTKARAVSAKVSLSCEDGQRIHKDYQIPTGCSCTTCGEENAVTDIGVPTAS